MYFNYLQNYHFKKVGNNFNIIVVTPVLSVSIFSYKPINQIFILLIRTRTLKKKIKYT